MQKDANVDDSGREKLSPLWSEMSNLVLKGNCVSEKVAEKLSSNLLKRRDDYLLSLKRIVCDSIENDKKDDVIVKRDNEFYCIECSKESVITPEKFLSNPEFQNLDGALKIGGGDVIRIKNGQYYDMTGKVKMTFIVGDEEVEMTLSSENTSNFGKIIVHMDDKNCEIFSKCCEELEKEPRISEVVKAAKSFVQDKPKPPLSSVDDTNIQHLQGNAQSVGKN
ncbi:hypothetical protein ID128_02695 [Candidatus Wolbachia massiliensis]|uniref:Uncharacterized protein n=2 Tax=Candidatus Wolbachia massiliensis TaxID=1845000 RepID=A0A7M3U343_9RICK|nr:hypothetical protein ID128_02695 [Candidatus Wolbachia massiliensis]